MRSLCLIMFAALFLSSLSAHALSDRYENQIVGVRIDDVIRHLPNELPELKKSLPSIKANIGRLLDIPEQVLEIHNLYFESMPDKKWLGKEITMPVVAFLLLEGRGYVFVKGIITQKGDRLSGRGVETVPLSSTNFEVEVGLVDRKVIIKDYGNSLKMVFPLGVGGFDEGIQNLGTTGLVTPRFQAAWLDKREAYASRTKPTYFAGKPFLRITTNQELNKGYTTIGFHAQPNLAPFFRGFDSHGCMRMQTDDLIAFHRLLSQGPLLHVPIRVLYHNYDQADHPFPKVDTPFKTILNVGTSSDPYFKLDSDELVQMVAVKNRQTPLFSLQDQYEDDYFNLYNYDSRERLLPEGGIPNRPPQIDQNPGQDFNDFDWGLPGIDNTPIRREPVRRQVNVGAYCKSKYPYQLERSNWRRNSMIRKYNRCLEDVTSEYRATGRLPHDIYNY